MKPERPAQKSDLCLRTEEFRKSSEHAMEILSGASLALERLGSRLTDNPTLVRNRDWVDVTLGEIKALRESVATLEFEFDTPASGQAIHIKERMAVVSFVEAMDEFVRIGEERRGLGVHWSEAMKRATDSMREAAGLMPLLDWACEPGTPHATLFEWAEAVQRGNWPRVQELSFFGNRLTEKHGDGLVRGSQLMYKMGLASESQWGAGNGLQIVSWAMADLRELSGEAAIVLGDVATVAQRAHEPIVMKRVDGRWRVDWAGFFDLNEMSADELSARVVLNERTYPEALEWTRKVEQHEAPGAAHVLSELRRIQREYEARMLTPEAELQK